MFESLKKKIAAIRGKATELPTSAVDAVGDSGRKIAENDVDDLLWELELGLLEADVALPVIEDIKESVKASLIGKRVDKHFEIDQVVESSLREAIENVLKKERVRLRSLH